MSQIGLLNEVLLGDVLDHTLSNSTSWVSTVGRLTFKFHWNPTEVHGEFQEMSSCLDMKQFLATVLSEKLMPQDEVDLETLELNKFESLYWKVALENACLAMVFAQQPAFEKLMAEKKAFGEQIFKKAKALTQAIDTTEFMLRCDIAVDNNISKSGVLHIFIQNAPFAAEELEVKSENKVVTGKNFWFEQPRRRKRFPLKPDEWIVDACTWMLSQFEANSKTKSPPSNMYQ